MANWMKMLVVISLFGFCSGELDRNLTAEFMAMNWTQLRDYVFDNTPTTTESVVHHYVQKVLHRMEGMEDKFGGAVKKEINSFTDGAADILFSYGFLIVACVVFAIVACGNLHFCCSIYKTERDTHKYVKEKYTDKTNETTTV